MTIGKVFVFRLAWALPNQDWHYENYVLLPADMSPTDRVQELYLARSIPQGAIIILTRSN